MVHFIENFILCIYLDNKQLKISFLYTFYSTNNTKIKVLGHFLPTYFYLSPFYYYFLV